MPMTAAKRKPASGRSKSDVIRMCFAAYKAKDRKVVEDLLTEDFRFTSPYDDEIDRATYFERCWPNSDQFSDVTVERIVEQGDSAYTTYKVLTNDGREFRNTEFMTFDGGRISHVDVYFGPSYRDGVFVKEKPG
jgi:ketosteroid isomerase-like protein